MRTLERIAKAVSPQAALAALLIAAFILVNGFNAVHKGGDAEVFFEGGRRALHGEPLYEGSGPASGFIGPPFQAVFFAPFAAIDGISRPSAKLIWYAVNVLALYLGVLFWSRSCRLRDGPADREGRLAARTVAPALLAVLLPLQTNFEHQNMNVLLLALLGQGTWCLQNRRDRTAGVLIGFASALKVFPAALIPFLAVAGFGRAAFAAVATAAGLTAMTIAIYGPIDAARELAAWWQVSSGGWPVRGQNQSLIAALDRATSAGLDGSGVNAPPDAPIAVVMYVLAAVGLIAAAVAVMPRRPRGAVLSCEVTAVIALSVLLSPVAWDHYWTLLFPAFLLVYRAGDRDLLGRHGIWAFCAAGLLTSGISPLTLGRTGFTIARGLSANTIAALVLYMAVLSLCHVLRRRDNAKRLAPSGAGRATD